MVAKPGVRPGAPAVARPGGPRPQHPTSRPRGMEPGLAPPPPDQPRGRRRPTSGPAAPQPRERSEEEKILRPQQRRHVEAGPPPINREITISEGITVKELSEKLDVKAALVMKKLMDRGIFAAINQTLDAKLATEIAREFGASTATVSYEEEAMQAVEDRRGAEGPAASARPWSPSWATSITARLRCSTPSAKPMWPGAKPAASRSTSARIRWR